jgi:NADPH:quinone reductase-like Zn-dependent oxidoreductase
LARLDQKENPMSRTVFFSQTGGPEVLKIQDEKVPSPGPGDVRILVKAIGLNRAESMWRTGQYVDNPKFPARIGYEASGIIDAVGSDAAGFLVGDEVSVIPGFSQNKYGTYGELVLMPAALVVKNPAGLSFDEAASVWMMFITAYGGLIETAKLTAGETVLIPGASSSVGLAAIQIVAAAGAIPVALTRTSAKREQLLKAGAAHVIATAEQDIKKEVDRITRGKGAEVVFDPVGGPTFSKLVEAMTDDGRFILYGALSAEPMSVSTLTLLSKAPTISVYGIFSTTTDPFRLKAAKKFVLDGLKLGSLTPVVGKLFSFEQIVESHRYLEGNDQFGKIVVKV